VRLNFSQFKLRWDYYPAFLPFKDIYFQLINSDISQLFF
jgi:hypothetical protein